MSDKAFVDTNVLVYAYDEHEPRKQRLAQILLTEGMQSESLVLSVQVLGELSNVLTRRIKEPMSAGEVQDIIAALSSLPVQEIDLRMVNRAIETHKAYRVSYWDALIVAAAERAGCEEILSEDLADSQLYHGIKVRNPFREYDLSAPER